MHSDIPHELLDPQIHLGVAGWNIRRQYVASFSTAGTHLQRYASRFNAVEINSCFYRPHRFTTYERWAASVPRHFQFAVKLPKVISHERRFVDVVPALEQFLAESAGLGNKLGPILVQIPPSFAYEPGVARSFFAELRARFTGDVVFEPRHETWFTNQAELVLRDYRIARVAADPALLPAAAEPGGYDRLVYWRLHGSPRMYYSAYPANDLERLSRLLEKYAAQDISAWCIFDNTALGAATADALTLKSHLLSGEPLVT